MVDIILILIIAAAVAWAIYFIIKSKKKGRSCMGCPYSDSCGKKDCCK